MPFQKYFCWIKDKVLYPTLEYALQVEIDPLMKIRDTKLHSFE